MRFISKLAISSAVIAIAFMSTANAQNMRVNVPFSFQAGSKALPAGQYDVSLNNPSQLLTLQQLDGKAQCYLLIKSTVRLGTPENGKLLFHRYGNSYFLTYANTPGGELGAEVHTSRAERELAKTSTGVQTAMVVASGK